MFNLPLNQQNLPYPDPIHPILVYFVIAMVLFSFVCDVWGYVAHQHRLFEVSFWNLFFAAIVIFPVIIFGQFEAGLAQPYKAAQSILNLHTVTGWSLAVLSTIIVAWRFAIRRQNPLKVSPIYLGAATLLSCLVVFQTFLGTQLVILAIAFGMAGTLFSFGKPIFKFLALPAFRSRFYDVGWYNLAAAAIITFATVLLLHGIGGVLLLAVIEGMTLWRGLQRYH
ncbi:DUF2231 domain-containing protein [Leptolyngbya sp. FACHB-16]|nr:DUF2231 domain-containing protein [Leptolyngbya sp. FACHB-16]